MLQRPSSRFGLRQTLRLRKLVLAVWLVALALELPLLVVLHVVLDPCVSQLPLDLQSMPPGDLLLVTLSSIERVRPLAISLGVLSCGGLWVWTVLWHASIVSWQVWFTGRELRLGEVIGMGLAAWWRFLRLSVMTAFVTGTVAVILWLGFETAASHVLQMGAEILYLVLLGSGGLFLLGSVAVSWTAGLWGAWLLGVPGSRSAAASWGRGLIGAVRAPVSTFSTLLAWAVPAFLLSLVPLVLGWLLPVLRGVGTMMVGVLVELGCSFCWVGLFTSFAPVTGLWSLEEEDG